MTSPAEGTSEASHVAKRLNDPQMRPLVRLLLLRPTVTARDMADALGIDVRAFRTRRNRDPFYHHLVEMVGRARSGGGRPQDRFRLAPAWRTAASRALGTPKDGGEVLVEQSVPQLDTIDTLLRRANEGRQNRLRDAYVLLEQAQSIYEKTRDRIEERRREGTLAVGRDLSIRLEKLDTKFVVIRRTIDLDGREKCREINLQAGWLASASGDDAEMARYFGMLPSHSVSGYGGTVCAFEQPVCQQFRLNFFLDERARDPATRLDFEQSIQHAVTEAMALTKFDKSWLTIAGEMISAIGRSPLLSSLNSLRNVLTPSNKRNLEIAASLEDEAYNVGARGARRGDLPDEMLPGAQDLADIWARA